MRSSPSPAVLAPLADEVVKSVYSEDGGEGKEAGGPTEGTVAVEGSGLALGVGAPPKPGSHLFSILVLL